MTSRLNDQSGRKPADLGETRRFHLRGVLTGAEAPTEADRVYLQRRGVLWMLTSVLAQERNFWRDVEQIHAVITPVDIRSRDNWMQLWRPAESRAPSYGVRGRAHRWLIATILLQAALNYQTRHSAVLALHQLGEHPVRLDGVKSRRGYARHDVTRLVRGAQMIASYRAGRCGAPDCHQPRQMRYCRRHGSQKAANRSHEEARLAALTEAITALQPEPLQQGGEYAMWLFRSKSELAS